MDRLESTMAFIDSGYTLASYREAHCNPNFRVSLPVWSELEKGTLLPPRQVQGQAGAPRKGPQPKARLHGQMDNCQRGSGSASGSASGAAAIRPVHGMSSVRRHITDLGVGGNAGGAPPPLGYGDLLRRSVTARRKVPKAVMRRGRLNRRGLPKVALRRGPGQVPALVCPKVLSTCRRSKGLKSTWVVLHQLIGVRFRRFLFVFRKRSCRASGQHTRGQHDMHRMSHKKEGGRGFTTSYLDFF